MDKISVIVAIFNVEKYVRQAIESILNQTYSNLEVILVDDGSVDASGKICEEYKNKDARVIVIHKENGGLSDARNAGLNIATGKYIMFSDADDFFELNSVEVMYKEIENKKADYVIGNYINVEPNGKKWDNPVFNQETYDNFKLSITDYEKSFFVMNSSACNKIFRKKFLDRLKLRFVKGIPAEDAIFSTYCFVNTDKVYYIKDIIYNYRQTYNASTISTKCTKKYFDGINMAYKYIFENFRRTDNLGFYRYFYAKNASYILCKFIDSDFLTKSDKKEIFDDFKWFFNLKDLLKANLTDSRLEEIIDCIKENKFEQAIQKMDEVKEYRKGLNKLDRDKMTKPTKEMYEKMSLYDSEFIYRRERICSN